MPPQVGAEVSQRVVARDPLAEELSAGVVFGPLEVGVRHHVSRSGVGRVSFQGPPRQPPCLINIAFFFGSKSA